MLSFWQWGLKQELTQCYKNQPTRDLLEYLSVFVCVSPDNADPILSTGIRHHGDERWRSQVTLCCRDNCVALSAIFYRSLSSSSSLFFFFSPYVSQPQLRSRLLECAEPSECCVWFPWHFRAACDSAKTRHALTSRAPAAASALLKHTKKQDKQKHNSWCGSNSAKSSSFIAFGRWMLILLLSPF